MNLMPKRVKYRKSQRGKIRGFATQGCTVAFGDFGLQSLEPGWISGRQLEAGRVAASHTLGTEGKVYVRVFPHKSVTAIPLETRMGKGKGEIEYYACVIKPGTVMYEVGGVSEELAREALGMTAHKLPLKMKFLKRRYKL